MKSARQIATEIIENGADDFDPHYGYNIDHEDLILAKAYLQLLADYHQFTGVSFCDSFTTAADGILRRTTGTNEL